MLKKMWSGRLRQVAPASLFYRDSIELEVLRPEGAPSRAPLLPPHLSHGGGGGGSHDGTSPSTAAMAVLPFLSVAEERQAEKEYVLYFRRDKRFSSLS